MCLQQISLLKKAIIDRKHVSKNENTPGYERNELAKGYTFRWGVETDYRVIHHEFLGKTTSNKFNVRYFNFMTGIVLRNSWKLSQQLFKNSYQNKFPKNMLTAKHWAKIIEISKDKNDILRSLRLWDDNTI